MFANGSGDLGSIPGRVKPKTQKMVLDASLLNTQHYKVRIKGKVEQSREGVAPFPTPWCSSYRKGSLRVTLDYGRQLYLLFLYVYIYIARETMIQSQVESNQKLKKWYLMPPCLSLSITMYTSRVEQSRERSSAHSYTSVLYLLKRDPSGRSQVRLPTLLFNIYPTRVMQSSSNELSNPVTGNAKM